MKKLCLATLALVTATACFDYKRAVTTLTLGAPGQPHTLRLVLEDITGDEEDCEESAQACAASVTEMLVSLQDSLVENGAAEVQGYFEADGEELDMVLVSKLPQDAKLIDDMNLEREEFGRSLSRLKQRWVVSQHSEVGELQGPPKKARPRVVHTFDDESSPIAIQRWELHPKTDTVQWIDVAHEDVEDVEDVEYSLLKRWPEMTSMLDNMGSSDG